jgi:coatomer protein complex subunit alpha (xenin)
MLTKFETKSAHVKGLSFHPKRPWVLARYGKMLFVGTTVIYENAISVGALDYKSYLRPIRANAMEERSPAEANGSC